MVDGTGMIGAGIGIATLGIGSAIALGSLQDVASYSKKKRRSSYPDMGMPKMHYKKKKMKYKDPFKMDLW